MSLLPRRWCASRRREMTGGAAAVQADRWTDKVLDKKSNDATRTLRDICFRLWKKRCRETHLGQLHAHNRADLKMLKKTFLWWRLSHMQDTLGRDSDALRENAAQALSSLGEHDAYLRKVRTISYV